MSKKVKRNILISIVLLVLVGASFGYYLYNKGPLDVKNSSAINLDAKDLYHQFIADSVVALKKYAGKILEVTGETTAISLNQKKEKIILLKTGTGGAFINCTLEEDPGEVKAGASIVIKGICSGIGQGDADMGIQGDVYLTRCYMIK